MYKGLAIIFGFLLLGELTSNILALPVPGSVLGMVYLTLALLVGLVRLEDVEREAEFLVRNMSVMFIPPGVGIMLYWGLVQSQLVPLALALVASFLATLLLTGKLVEALGGEGP
ncbi:CidA/LrgA family protein [Infirmifilum lucidum]|uniref:CidA/LrgA family protein n=1 Tax=Infirmifilum lucidum TaxID=2776706 RepID=A0A7L9FJG1_9CREN|nr:CidA/LrgA family protein [Infirmifilum lucidum]QOJ79064.1 CidA/LrgA family protein [Infirmifilum lucidum]